MLPDEQRGGRDKIQLIAPARSLQIVGPPPPRRRCLLRPDTVEHGRSSGEIKRRVRTSSSSYAPRAYRGVGFRFDTNDPPPAEKPPVEFSGAALLAAVIDYRRIKAGVSADNPRRYGNENGIDSGGASDRG